MELILRPSHAGKDLKLLADWVDVVLGEMDMPTMGEDFVGTPLVSGVFLHLFTEFQE